MGGPRPGSFTPCNVCNEGEVSFDATLLSPVCLKCGAFSARPSPDALVAPSPHEVIYPNTPSFDDSLRAPSRREKRLRVLVSEGLSHHGVTRMPLRIRRFVMNIARLYKKGVREQTLRAAAASVVMLEVGRQKRLTFWEVGRRSGVEAGDVRREYGKIVKSLGVWEEERSVNVRSLLRRAVRLSTATEDLGHEQRVAQEAERILEIVERSGRQEGYKPMRIAFAIALVAEEVLRKRRRIGAWNLAEKVGVSGKVLKREVALIHDLLLQKVKEGIPWSEVTKENVVEYAHLCLNIMEGEKGQPDQYPACFRASLAKKAKIRAIIEQVKGSMNSSAKLRGRTVAATSSKDGKPGTSLPELDREARTVQQLCEAGASEQEIVSGHYESLMEKYGKTCASRGGDGDEDEDAELQSAPISSKETLARAALLNAITKKIQHIRTKGNNSERQKHQKMKDVKHRIKKREIDKNSNRRGPRRSKMSISVLKTLEREGSGVASGAEGISEDYNVRHDLFRVPDLLRRARG